MYYTNSIKVTLKDTESAIKALEILRNRLDAGFEVDEIYKEIPSQNMSEALAVVENAIVLPKDFGCYITEDAEDVMFELIQHLAENIGNASFSWDGWNCNTYTEGHFEAVFENSVLNIEYTYYPSGAGVTVLCNECDAEIIHLDNYEEGKTYVCPECGEVIDMSEYIPAVTQKTIQIF